MKFGHARILVLLIALLPSLATAAEQAMGRLFFTPEQRARMNVARQQERSIKIDTEQPENEPPAANITLNGVITRSDGKTTVWINNKEQSGEKAGSGVIVPGRGKPAGQISVTTPDAQRTVPLKVGQSIDMSSGRVEDAYRQVPSAKQETPAASSGTPPAPVRQQEAPDSNDTPLR